MKNIKFYLTVVVAFLPVFATVGSGLAKLFGAAPIVENMTKFHLASSLIPLGVAEIIFAALYVYPKTMNIGFFLLCGYFGGAMAVHLSYEGAILTPATFILTLYWVATYLRKPSLFSPLTLGGETN